jgi:hypothetical protein
MPRLEGRGHIIQGYALTVQQYQQVVNEVCRFAEHFLPVSGDSGNSEFDRFLTDLLGHAFLSGGKETARIAIFDWVLQSILNNKFECAKKL